MATSALMPTALLVALLLASVVPGQCRRTFPSGDSGVVTPVGEEVVNATKIMIPIAESKLLLNGKVFKCCVHSQTGAVNLQDMSEDLPRERTFCMDKEGCGCMFGDHFHSYDYSSPTCEVELSYLSRVTGESAEHLWNIAISDGKRVTDALPAALDTCHATRPNGFQTQNIYCTQDQGFACEVFTVGFQPDVHVKVWNSYGCGCDARAFRVGSWSLKKRPNGPRIWTADTVVSAGEPTSGSFDETGRDATEVFDGITYKYDSELDYPYLTMIVERGVQPLPFVRSKISRTGERIWKKGRQVYELKVADDTYIMEAISQQVDPMLTDNSGLKDLLSRKIPEKDTFGNAVEEHLKRAHLTHGMFSGGSAMALPEGMTYRCRVLAEDLILESHGTAVIMQDHFHNSYMLENVNAKYADEGCVEETEQWRLDYCSKSVLLPWTDQGH